MTKKVAHLNSYRKESKLHKVQVKNVIILTCNALYNFLMNIIFK